MLFRSGNGIPLTAKDGSFDSTMEDIEFTLDTSDLSVGVHSLFIRMNNDEGIWGTPRKIIFEVTGEKHISGAEYFIDNDPGLGNGISISPFDGSFDQTIESITAEIDTSDLSLGLHTIYIRMKDSEDHWGTSKGYKFEVREPPYIKEAEYYVDDNSGVGTALDASDANFDSAIEEIKGILDTSGLNVGTHTLYVRAKDSYFRWGELKETTFEVIIEETKLTVNKDGTGSGTVTSSPSGITCGTDCTENYNKGTVVALTAISDTDSTFDGWSGGGCSDTGTCEVTLNADTTVTAIFQLNDTTPPTGSITINSGAAYTNLTSVTLTLSATDDENGVSEMCISNTTSCSSWESYTTSKSWTLTSGDGTKTVYVWFKDSVGNANVTPADSDSIILDTTPPSNPTSVNSPSHTPNTWSSDKTVDINWSGASDTTSGIDGYSYIWDTSPSTMPDTTVDTTGNSTTSSSLPDSNSHYFHIRTKDNAGNWNTTAVHKGPFYIDGTAPNDGALSATPGDAQVSLSWSGFSDGTSSINSYNLVYSTGGTPSSCSSGTQIYSGSGASYTHSSLTNGKTYYYRICAIDNAGNTSTGATDNATPQAQTYTLNVNITPPGGGIVTGTGINCPGDCSETYNSGINVSLTATANSGYTFSSWSGCDSSSGNACTMTMNVPKSVTTNFIIKTYTITATAGSGGAITPSGAVTVNHGDDQTFTITPDTWYHVADVKVDGSSVGAVTTHTFNNVTADHTIHATFNPTDNIPTLDWVAGETNGVEPDSGIGGDTFTFLVEYTDADNDPPTTREVWIDLDDSGTYDTGEKFTMNEDDTGDTDYTDGKDYAYSTATNYAGDGTLKYKFSFSDGTSNATGNPAIDQTFTVSKPAAPPDEDGGGGGDGGGGCFITTSGL